MTHPVDGTAVLDAGPGRADLPVLDRIAECVREVSLGFEGWDDPRARGPGLHFVVETGAVVEFADPVGTNRWPVEDCASVFDDADALLETARAVAFDRDGAVVVRDDGTIEERMVRLKQLSPEELARPRLPVRPGSTVRLPRWPGRSAFVPCVTAPGDGSRDDRAPMTDDNRRSLGGRSTPV